jgi:HYR domain-containing protein
VTVTRTGVPAGNFFPVGDTFINYTATDRSGNTAMATQKVTVTDTTPPSITAPPNVTASTGPGATTCDTIVSNTTLGTATATDNCGAVTITRSPSGNTFPVGTTTIVWTATDGVGNTSTANQTVTVVDDTVPVITTNGQTLSMWPPNHNYQTFQVTNFVTGASDNCGGVTINDVVIEKVTSDETENGNGDGNTTNDIVIASDCKSVQLRAERQESADGRVYTITFKVTDSSGNVGRATAKVVVPTNTGETAVDSGVNYTVNGTCP